MRTSMAVTSRPSLPYLVSESAAVFRLRVMVGSKAQLDEDTLFNLHECRVGRPACPGSGSPHWQAGALW